ncbi:MAG: M3 family oligoendopeptidase, partial [Acidobacteria bacterium]|nr:M3 family oligoendopeptidase [Acidobacteriota bacterium]
MEKAYLDYVENVLPLTEPLYFELSKKYLAASGRALLPQDRYFVYDRARQSEVKLFRAENVTLQTQDEVLAQQYQKTCGEQTVEFDSKTLTLPQVYKILEETDRDRRRKAWIAGVDRQLADREKMETLFDEMLTLR